MLHLEVTASRDDIGRYSRITIIRRTLSTRTRTHTLTRANAHGLVMPCSDSVIVSIQGHQPQMAKLVKILCLDA